MPHTAIESASITFDFPVLGVVRSHYSYSQYAHRL